MCGDKMFTDKIFKNKLSKLKLKMVCIINFLSLKIMYFCVLKMSADKMIREQNGIMKPILYSICTNYYHQYYYY